LFFLTKHDLLLWRLVVYTQFGWNVEHHCMTTLVRVSSLGRSSIKPSYFLFVR